MAELGMAFLNPIIASQKAAQDAALAPVHLEHEQALTREATARATRVETEAEGEKRAAALMAQQLSSTDPSGAPKPVNLSDLLLGQAHIYAASGLPGKATLALTGASTVMAHEAVAANQKALREEQDLRAKSALFTRFAGMMDGVTDQDTWTRANQTYKAAFGKDSPYANQPYDPEVVASIKANALTAKQKTDVDLAAKQEARRQATAASTAAHRAVQDETARADLRLRQAREDRLAKAGGKDVGSPNTAETKAASRLLQAQPGLVSDEDLEVAAFDVAAQARGKRRANPGLTSDEAIRQVIAEKRAAGDFTPGEKTPWYMKDGKPKYGVVEPLPASGKRADLVVGKKYKNGSGVVQEWTGSGWKKPGPATTPTAAPAGGGAPDDEEEE